MRKFLALMGALLLCAVLMPEAAKVRNDSLTPEIVRSSVAAASFCNFKVCGFSGGRVKCVPDPGDNNCFPAGGGDCLDETCN